MPDLNQLIKEGIFDIELGVANPRTSGVSAGEGAIGYATDNTRWVKVGPNDTDWEQILISKNGEYIVDFQLGNATGTVPDVNSLGVSGGVPSIGDGITPNGRKVLMNTKPAGMAYMVSTADSGHNVFIQVKTTTGNAAIRWWDGTVEEGGDGSGDGVADNITFTKAVPADGGAWSGPSPKEIYVWSSTDAAIPTDPTQVGDITYLNCSNNNLTTLDVSDLTALTSLFFNNNNLTTLDVSGLTALTFLNCSNNNLTTLDVSDLTALTTLSCNSNNNLTTLDVSGLTALFYLKCANNPNLVEVIAVDFEGASPYGSTYYSVDFTDCGLPTDAVWSMLNQCANANDNPSFIKVSGNPCDKNDGATTPEAMTDGTTYTESDVQTLLNAKGYSLVLSDATLAPA